MQSKISYANPQEEVMFSRGLRRAKGRAVFDGLQAEEPAFSKLGIEKGPGYSERSKHFF